MAEVLPLKIDRKNQREKWLWLSREGTRRGWASLKGKNLFDYFHLNELQKNGEFQEDPQLSEKQLEEKVKERLNMWRERIEKNLPPFEIPRDTIRWEKVKLSFRDTQTGVHYKVPGLTPKESKLETEPGRRL